MADNYRVSLMGRLRDVLFFADEARRLTAQAAHAEDFDGLENAVSRALRVESAECDEKAEALLREIVLEIVREAEP